MQNEISIAAPSFKGQDPTLPPGYSNTFRHRFWAKVNKTETCWLWTGSVSRDGYGQIGKGENQPGNVVNAHTASWIMNGGSIPDGLVLRHKCPGGPNPACVNPEHLWLGTKKSNTQDAIQIRRETGKAHWNAKKLTMEKVSEIRRLHDSTNMTNVEIGRMFGVNPHYISKIIHGHAWNRPGCLIELSEPAETGPDIEYYI